MFTNPAELFGTPTLCKNGENEQVGALELGIFSLMIETHFLCCQLAGYPQNY